MHTPRDLTKKRDTARGIVLKDGCILLIDRIRPGMRYFSTPGGGIEINETAEQAVIREVMEETSINISIEQKVYIWREGLNEHHFFLCAYIDGEPMLSESAEEYDNGLDNQHIPRWVTMDEAIESSFGYWQPLKKQIIFDIENGFSDKLQIINGLEAA